MPSKQIVTDDKLWKPRIDGSNKYYDKWANLFKCNTLEKYYEGFQWRGQVDNEYRAYVINNIYEIVQLKLDEFIPQFPQFTVSPKPGNADFDLETAALSAQLKQDVLNTIIDDSSEHFHDEIEQAYKDSYFRFGMVEVGYAADWILNPNAGKPLLNKHVDQNAQGSKPKIRKEPDELPINERIYFKHIPAKRFRVGGMDHKYLQRCGWCGYYEWVYKDDLLALPGILNRDKIETTTSSETPDAYTNDRDNRDYKPGDVAKIWRIWDNRAQLSLILLDSPCVTLWQRPFKRLPLFDLRPDRRVSDEGFYPIPPIWHWLSPQDEINETREQLRAHRRRFLRKFQVVEGAVDDEEIQKFETGPDGALVKVKRENAITPIQNADSGAALDKAIVTSADDLNRISGTSSEQRGVADRTTATQANIINQRSTIRESSERDSITRWLCGMGREVLLTVREKFTLGIWANLTSDNEQYIGMEMKENQKVYDWVTTEKLQDGYDFRILLDVTSLSVASQEQEKKKFFEFLAVVTQFPAIAMSPKLIREAAYRCGYRNESVIREMQKMALLHQLGTMNGIQQATGGQQAAQGIVAQQTPNGMEQIRQQLTNQLRPQ